LTRAPSGDNFASQSASDFKEVLRMRFVPLASGSSGNSFLVQNNGSAILVDAGLTAKQLVLRMESIGFDPSSLNAIIVSHGHSDHVKGAGVLSRKLKLPVWMNQGTWDETGGSLGKIHELRTFETGRIFDVAGFRIHPFSVPHDSADPVGFRISFGCARLGIATDLGTATNLVANVLTGLQALVLESNHDPKMLIDGPYPWELKQRVRSRVGHLSNAESAKLIQRLVNDELHTVILAHMSETNNTPDLALDCAGGVLDDFLDQKGALYCARQDSVGPVIEW
jgi:phosphoribosyl 1,2-cyclic phosphodiesterase